MPQMIVFGKNASPIFLLSASNLILQLLLLSQITVVSLPKRARRLRAVATYRWMHGVGPVVDVRPHVIAALAGRLQHRFSVQCAPNYARAERGDVAKALRQPCALPPPSTTINDTTDGDDAKDGGDRQ